MSRAITHLLWIGRREIGDGKNGLLCCGESGRTLVVCGAGGRPVFLHRDDSLRLDHAGAHRQWRCVARHPRSFIFEEYQWLDMLYCHMLPFSEIHQWELETRMPDLAGSDFEEWCDYVARDHCARYRDDPNHLILGDRYEANAPLPEEVVRAALPYVAVLSFQCFGTRENIRDKMTRWAGLGRPVLLADAAGWIEPHTRGQDRLQSADHYAGVMEDLLGIPECVGYNLCGAYLRNRTGRVGFRDTSDRPIASTAADFRKANAVIADENSHQEDHR